MLAHLISPATTKGSSFLPRLTARIGGIARVVVLLLFQFVTTPPPPTPTFSSPERVPIQSDELLRSRVPITTLV